jgi:hypothetical protein
MCETGGARRSWLRGLQKVSKRYLIQAAAHNLGVLMRKLFGMGTPRGLQSPRSGLAFCFSMLIRLWLTPPAQIWRRLDPRHFHRSTVILHHAV